MKDQYTQKELLNNILNIPSETQTIEFKRLSDEKVIVKVVETVVAMANTEGGVIVLGVDDPEKTKLNRKDRIFGINEKAEVFDALGREIQRITPPLSGIWPPQIIEDNNKKIGVLFIPKALLSFHSINNHVFVRAEKSNRQLNAHEIVKFAYAKGFEKADRALVDVDFSLLKTSAYEEWKESRGIGETAIESVLEKTGLARKNTNSKLLPTFAAVLLFAEFPNDLTEAKCAIRVLQHTGTIETIGETPNLISLPKTIQGSLVKQISSAHEYVLSLLRAGIRIPSGFKNIYKIPERAVKEAITNAVIHRDYHMKRDIVIKIF
ncbi:MAG: putative DNA binding domain-containing protein [Candidatus Omnitrophica bacterium]|nr:putative DNA binding domain-containing protein [Candidatus Omnitrophota bacterium]